MVTATLKAHSMRLSPSMTSLLCSRLSTDPVFSSNVVGIAVISRDTPTTSTPAPDAPQVCPASFTCPENNGCSYTDGSRTLILTCGFDFYGGDFTNQYAASLEACTQACADDAQCVAASFVGGKRDGTCYLKNTKNGDSANDGVDGK